MSEGFLENKKLVEDKTIFRALEINNDDKEPVSSEVADGENTEDEEKINDARLYLLQQRIDKLNIDMDNALSVFKDDKKREDLILIKNYLSELEDKLNKYDDYIAKDNLLDEKLGNYFSMLGLLNRIINGKASQEAIIDCDDVIFELTKYLEKCLTNEDYLKKQLEDIV